MILREPLYVQGTATHYDHVMFNGLNHACVIGNDPARSWDRITQSNVLYGKLTDFSFFNCHIPKGVDTGIVYFGRSLKSSVELIDFYFEDCSGIMIYLDDCYSNVRIVNPVCINCSGPMFNIGGGKNIEIINPTYVTTNLLVPSSVDNRGRISVKTKPYGCLEHLSPGGYFDIEGRAYGDAPLTKPIVHNAQVLVTYDNETLAKAGPKFTILDNADVAILNRWSGVIKHG